jgi:hypothetical protein
MDRSRRARPRAHRRGRLPCPAVPELSGCVDRIAEA